MSDSKNIPLGLKIIGTMKLMTALLLWLAAFGAFKMLHRDIGEVLEHYVLRMHLDTDNYLVYTLLEKVGGIDNTHLQAISAGALVYGLLYMIEGIGLLRGKHWAEYLVVFITASLLPVEIYEVMQKTSGIRIAVLAMNLVILGYLLRQLKREKQKRFG